MIGSLLDSWLAASGAADFLVGLSLVLLLLAVATHVGGWPGFVFAAVMGALMVLGCAVECSAWGFDAAAARAIWCRACGAMAAAAMACLLWLARSIFRRGVRDV